MRSLQGESAQNSLPAINTNTPSFLHSIHHNRAPYGQRRCPLDACAFLDLSTANQLLFASDPEKEF